MPDEPAPGGDARELPGAAKAVVMAERKRDVASLLARGRTLRQAADESGLTLNQVKAAYRAVLNELRASYLKDADRHRARLVLANRAAQAELWRRYEAVRDTGKTVRAGTLVNSGEKSDLVGQVEVTQSTAPDTEVKFLQAILKAQEQEAKILGVYDKAPAAEDPARGGINIERGIIVMNNAELGPSEWVRSLPRQFAEQGKGVIEVAAEPAPEAPAPEPDEVLS